MTGCLDFLEHHYGAQQAPWPSDPYLFLVWWNCGYPASDAACAKGWEALNRTIGTSPDRILATPDTQLTRILKIGGLVPDVRARRLKELADRTLEEFSGDLAAGLRGMPLAKARATLKCFEGIADSGADRILLFGGISAVAAVPSNNTQVILRIEAGGASGSYSRDYKQAQQLLSKYVPETFAARQRAYLLLKRHGEQICKRSKPRCEACPIAKSCKLTAAR